MNNRSEHHNHDQNYNRGNRNHNNTTDVNPTELENRIRFNRDRLPYTFIPIKNNQNHEDIKQAKFNTTEMDGNKLYTGYLNCSMYALNQLLVGNEHSDGESNSTHIYPLKVNDRILISPYTLKGCISSFIASYTNTKMRRVNSKGFIMRPNLNFRPSDSVKMGIGIVLFTHDNSLTFSHFGSLKDVPVIYSTKQDYENYTTIHNNRLNLNPYNHRLHNQQGRWRIRNYDDNAQETTLYCLKYSNGLDGNGTFARLFNGNIHTGNHDCIYIPKQYFRITGNQHSINKETKNGYESTFLTLKKYHLEDHPLDVNVHEKEIKKNWDAMIKLKQGDVIFYEYTESSKRVLRENSEEFIEKTLIHVKTFGKTFYYPWAFDKEINSQDFPDDIKVDDGKSIVDEMFGYSVDNNSKSGKVHFNFAICDQDLKTTDIILPRTGSPKPSSYEFYLQQNNRNKVVTYGEPLNRNGCTRLSGRKVFKRTTNPAPSLSNPIDYSVIMHEAIEASPNKPIHFKFRVNFNNLTINEYLLLKLALELDGEEKFEEAKYAHQIGYAKNKGLGTVKFFVDNGFINNEDYKSFNEDLRINYKKMQQTFIESIGKYFKIVSQTGSYPKENGQIMSWHAKIRGDYAKLRRQEYCE